MYEVKIKYDSKGSAHICCYVPSLRGAAWIEPQLPKDERFRAMILDENFLPAWKVAWLAGEYEFFIAKERSRKKEWGNLEEEWLSLDEAENRPSEELRPDKRIQDKEEEKEIRETLKKALDLLNKEERRYVLLRYVNCLSFKEIARLEACDELTITRRAGAIQRKVSRALEKMRKRLG